MSPREIADRLVFLCRKGDFEDAQKELFAAHAVSIEAEATPNFAKETHGLEAIIQKGHKFGSMVEEIHSLAVSDALVAADAFTCTLEMDLTIKGRGRITMAEVCVYVTKNGKIISESFYM